MNNHTMWYSLPNGPRFSWYKHPSWAAVLVHPCTHGFIQAADPAWGELFCHIGLYDLSDLPEAIPEGWWAALL